jgi:hypothetical protein
VVPPNTTALLSTAETNASSFLLDGLPLAENKKLHAEDADRFELPAGSYNFTARVK